MKRSSCLFVAPLAAVLLALPAVGIGQQTDSSPDAQAASLDQQLPIDPNVTVGQFDNGLRYYLRVNRQPENRAELRLVVNAGSVLEDDDQLGVAHFVEHMAFNGTENFAKHELVDFMESIGMRLGPDVNAYTSFDETVYMLRIPTDSPESMETAFQVLDDWSRAVTFEDGEIDKERGVVIEEWRRGRGAGARMRDKQFPILFHGSRYADRLPIGDPQILESFDYDVPKRFYRDWYRPDLMAVIAVGDFDETRVMQLIRQHFEDLPIVASLEPRPFFDLPDHDETLFAIATDKEAPFTSVAVYHKLPLQDSETMGAYRQMIVERLYNGMLTRRFTELAQQPDPPFLGASSGKGRFIRSGEIYVLSAGVKEDGIETGLEALFVESERVARFGFTESELARQKAQLLRNVEQSYDERNDTDSNRYAGEYVRAFLEAEPIPGIGYEFELHKRFVPEITLAEVNNVAREWLGEGNRVVTVSATEKEGLSVPTEEELLAVLESVGAKSITAYEDTVGEEPLLAEAPMAGAITEETLIEEMNITEWRLSNGARVVVMPTDYQEDEIVFRAISPGGSSLASDEDYVPASSAAMVIARGGLGGFNQIDLRKKLAGKVVRVNPFIGSLEEGLVGRASSKDVETLFQLIYMTFTAPRADPTMFEVMSSQTKAQIENFRASPEFTFSEAIQTTMSQNHPRRRPMSVELIDEWDLDKSFAFYKDRFADASDFTFVFVGNLDLRAIKPLVERYLASLPSIDRTEVWRDEGVDPPTGVIHKDVRKGIEPKSQTSIIFTGPFQYDRAHRNAIRAMSLVLQNRLRDVLREDLGGTYSVGVRQSVTGIPDEAYTLRINFGSDPDRVEELVGVVFETIEEFKSSGPEEQEVADARENMYRTFETDSERNGFWLGSLAMVYREGRDPRDLLEWVDSLTELTPEVIQEAARAYLNVENYVRVSLFPEQ